MSKPRNVRNFWIEADIDGQSTQLSGGPKSKDGGFRLTVKMRHHGEIVTAAVIAGEANDKGGLVFYIRPMIANGAGLLEGHTFETER